MDHKHYLIHKPYGFLSQFVCEHKKKKLLGELHDFPAGTMAIGRLDEDSEGLLLLTTDGKMSEIVRSKKVDKEYYVQVDGIITQEAIDEMKNKHGINKITLAQNLGLGNVKRNDPKADINREMKRESGRKRASEEGG